MILARPDVLVTCSNVKDRHIISAQADAPVLVPVLMLGEAMARISAIPSESESLSAMGASAFGAEDASGDGGLERGRVMPPETLMDETRETEHLRSYSVSSLNHTLLLPR